MACTTFYHCDRCGDRIQPDDRSSFKPTTGPKRHDPPIDLCGECLAALAAWLGPVPGRKPQKVNGAA